MKIAVPTIDGRVDDHFGHCAYYTIFDIIDGKISGVSKMASPERRAFVQRHYPTVQVVTPDECIPTAQGLERGGADVVIEVAGAEGTFELAWKSARPNAVVAVVALYDRPQVLPLPDMYGKNLTFKTGGVDGCDCAEILSLIEEGKIDTTPLITHSFPLSRIEDGYKVFENKEDGVIKVAIDNRY